MQNICNVAVVKNFILSAVCYTEFMKLSATSHIKHFHKALFDKTLFQQALFISSSFVALFTYFNKLHFMKFAGEFPRKLSCWKKKASTVPFNALV